MASGQKLVKPNWNRLAPTKAVKASAISRRTGQAFHARASEILMNRRRWLRILAFSGHEVLLVWVSNGRCRSIVLAVSRKENKE